MTGASTKVSAIGATSASAISLKLAPPLIKPRAAVVISDADGTPHELPPIALPRASKRISFVPGRHALIILQGEMRHVNSWYVDLNSGRQRQLSDFGREFAIGDFDVTAGGEIVFDRRRDNSDIALIELQGG